MKKETLLNLKLKPFWDFPQSYEETGSRSGIFAGRNQEKEKLIDILRRKKSGSILVCGARGAGKTSLVYRALKEAGAGKERILPVVLNASQLEEMFQVKEGEKIEKKEVIVNLVRRLYDSVSKGYRNDLSDDLSELYFKSVAKDWQLRKEKKRDFQHSESEENSISVSGVTKINALSLLTKALGSFLLALSISSNKTWSQYLLGCLGAGSFLASDFTIWYERSWLRKKVDQTLSTKKDLASEAYLIDNNIGNLESDLSSVLRTLSGKFRIVFIVDELDKFEKVGDILDLIKTYKNLFTLSQATFIFITGTEVYEAVIDGSVIHKTSTYKPGDSKVSPEMYRTIFTDVYYLSRPNFKDISGYLDEILLPGEIDKLTEEGIQAWGNLKHYLSYEAEDDFFKLVRVIKDHLHCDSDGSQRIELTSSDFLSEQLAKASFHKILSSVFDIFSLSKPTKWQINENLYSGLFDVARVIQVKTGSEYALTLSDDDFVRSAQETFLEILEKNGSQKTPIIRIKSKEENTVRYTWTQIIPGDLLDLNEPFSHEVKFIESLEALISLCKELQSLFKKDFPTTQELMEWTQAISGIAVAENFTTYETISNDIRVNKKHYNIEDVTNYDDDLKAKIEGFVKSIVNTYANGLISDLPEATRGNLEQPHLFSVLPENLRKALITRNHIIISNPQVSKQLLLLEECSSKEFKEISKSTENAEFSYLAIAFNQEVSLTPQEIIKWYEKEEVPLDFGEIDRVEVVSGAIRRRSSGRSVLLEKRDGVSIDGKNPNTFVVSQRAYKDFEVTGKVRLKPDTIFNFVFNFNENPERQQSYYMIRLDTRKSGKNSILQADFGAPWRPIFEVDSNTTPDKSYKFEYTLLDKVLNVLLNDELIIAYTFTEELYGRVGLMNELNDVTIETPKFTTVRELS